MRVLMAALVAAFCLPAQARDDGRYAQAPLHDWFKAQHSKTGVNCCSVADATMVQDADWDNQGTETDIDSAYRVRLGGVWISVPRTAVIDDVPNKAGTAVAWPYQDQLGETKIRCFIPGAGT